jgi:prepilin-type N-terminal cleavage/methylation domain-containing protein
LATGMKNARSARDRPCSPSVGRGADRNRPGAWPAAGCERGLTLIETLFVVVLLAILTTLAFASHRNVVMQRHVQNVARELAAGLRVAQQAAVAKAAVAACVGVSFRAARADVRVMPIEGPPVDCENPTAGGLEAGGLLLRSHEYPIGVTVAVSPGGSTGALAFLPSGAPCAGSGCTRQVRVAGGAHRRYVCIAAGTGLVTVQDAACPP